MKKSTILTFATAAAVLATSAGTFAVWDQLEAKTSAVEVTIRKPATVTADTPTAVQKTEIFDAAPEYTTTAKFVVSDIPETEENNYKFTPTVEVKDGADDVTSTVNATVKDAGTTLNGEHVVTVTIAPNANDEAAKNLADKPLLVTVNGKVEKVSSGS